MAVGKVSLDVAVHGNGHLLKSGHEVGSSEHHSLLHVFEVSVQILLSRKWTASQTADQTADQSKQRGPSGDDELTVEAAVARLLLHYVLPMSLEDRSWTHHQPGVSSVEVTDGPGGHSAQHLEANEDLCLAVQVTAHGSEQVLIVVRLLGGQRVAPVGADGQSAKSYFGSAN